jgi:hypothetical protein
MGAQGSSAPSCGLCPQVARETDSLPVGSNRRCQPRRRCADRGGAPLLAATLTRVLALARSPSRTALKILCRSRRTVFSWWRQSMASHGSTPPWVGFTSTSTPSAAMATSKAKAVIASNSSFGSGGSGRCSSKAHLPTSARFRGRASSPVSGRLSETAAWSASRCPGFPLPFGHRHWLLGHPVSARELGSPYGRLTSTASNDDAMDPDGVSMFRTHETRLGSGALCTPGTAVNDPRVHRRRSVRRRGRHDQAGPGSFPGVIQDLCRLMRL